MRSPPSNFFHTLCSSLFIYHNLLSTLAALRAAVSLVEILVSSCSLSHFVTLFALRSSQNCSVFWLPAWHAERKSFTFGVLLLLFDLITNLGSVVCPRNANIHLHSSFFSEILQPQWKTQPRSLSKYSDSKLKLSMQTEYAQVHCEKNSRNTKRIS